MSKRNLYRVKKHRISLTALIDVVFILLLFFMLTTSFSQWRVIDVSTAAGIETDINKETVNLFLMPDETVSLYGQNVAFREYKDIKVSDLLLEDINKSVVLLPHQDVPLQLLINVTQHLKEVGLQNVSIGHSFGDEIHVANTNGDLR